MWSKILRNQKKYQINEDDTTESLPLSLRKEEYTSTGEAFLALEDLKNKEEGLLVELRKQREILGQLQLRISEVTEQRRRLMMKVGDQLSSEQNAKINSNFRLFSVETWGSAWTDGLVFTVMAENEVWAKHIVREWLKSNGRENHRIDKIQALMSNDLRAVINVGTKLLDV